LILALQICKMQNRDLTQILAMLTSKLFFSNASHYFEKNAAQKSAESLQTGHILKEFYRNEDQTVDELYDTPKSIISYGSIMEKRMRWFGMNTMKDPAKLQKQLDVIKQDAGKLMEEIAEVENTPAACRT
jgi:hypothetical protein